MPLLARRLSSTGINNKPYKSQICIVIPVIIIDNNININNIITIIMIITMIFCRITKGVFMSNLSSTLGVDFQVKFISVLNSLYWAVIVTMITMIMIIMLMIMIIMLIIMIKRWKQSGWTTEISQSSSGTQQVNSYSAKGRNISSVFCLLSNQQWFTLLQKPCSGQERFRSVTKTYFRRADGVPNLFIFFCHSFYQHSNTNLLTSSVNTVVASICPPTYMHGVCSPIFVTRWCCSMTSPVTVLSVPFVTGSTVLM